jgi:hypothetical protein
MTDAIIQSNLQNPILAGLFKAFTSDLGYKSGKNYPALSKSIVGISPNVAPSNPPYNSEMTFNIPRLNFMDDLMIESTFTVSTITNSGALTNPDPGFTIFGRIELLAQNKVVSTVYPSAIRAEVVGMDFDKCLAYTRMAGPCDSSNGLPLTAFGTGSTYVTYTPVFSSLLRNERTALDLTKLEDLQLRCYYNTSALSGLANVSALTSVSAKLYMWSHAYESEYYAKLRAENFKVGGLLNMLTWDYFRETYTPVTSATSTTLDLRCNGSAMWTAISLHDANNVLQKIQSVSFRANGRSILENIPPNIISLEQFTRGSCFPFVTASNNSNAVNALNVSNARDMVVLYWNLGSENSDEQKGVLSLRGLSNPQIVINHPAIQSGWIITVIHKILTITSLSQDGSVTVSSTS